jgi:pyruvate/2-oxoglutarate dehydrogenase complex dihydrolipoamide acyltransferase (E2) component
MAVHEITVPHFGPNVDDGRLVRWLKNVGDPVAASDALCYYETSKATFEIEAERSGYLLKALYLGERVPVLAIIGYLGDSPDDVVGGA